MYLGEVLPILVLWRLSNQARVSEGLDEDLIVTAFPVWIKVILIQAAEAYPEMNPDRLLREVRLETEPKLP